MSNILPRLPGPLSRLFILLCLFFALILLLLDSFALFPGHSVAPEHPVPFLLARATQHHQHLVGNRSTTLRQAVDRYVGTHRRSPPPRFDEWFYAAQAINACTIDRDRFSELYSSLEPWWALTPAEIRRRNNELSGGNALGRIVVKGGKVLSSSEMREAGLDPGPLRGGSAPTAFAEMLEEAIRRGATVPDLDMHVNALDEPRVTLPYELRTSLDKLASKQTVRKPVLETPIFREMSQDNPYDVIRQACPPNSLARLTPLAHHPGTAPHISHKYTHHFTTNLGHFLASPRLERETWCDQPDLQDLHATFIRPLSMSYTQQMYPVFSNSKIKGFNDILIPSWYYWQNWQPYLPEEDIDWKAKADQGWIRSRVVSRLNRPSEWRHQDHLYLATSSGSAVRTNLPSHILNAGLTDVAFSKPDTFGDADSLSHQRTEPSFRFTGVVPFKSNYRSKAVLDMDGTAYSGRFLALMASKSAVFKSRLFISAMEEDLVPWHHFIPVSVRFTELYSLLGYFFGVRKPVRLAREEGIKIQKEDLNNAILGVPHEEDLKRVAENGAEWASQCMRKEDAVNFVHLLALEWARLCDDDRDRTGFVLKEGDSL